LEVPALGTLAGAPPRGVSGSPAFSAGYQPCLSLPTLAQSDRPVAKAGEPLDFGHMSDRQVNEFVASELKELKEQAALVRSALTILATLQVYALDADAATWNRDHRPRKGSGDTSRDRFPGPWGSEERQHGSDRERASAFRGVPPK